MPFLSFQLKTFRSLCADPGHHAQILAHLRILLPPLQGAVKDLRSQVGREACLTVAYLTSQLGVKADFFVEPLLGTLFTLLVANAKIVSLTGGSTLSLIYEFVPSFRLLPPLLTQMGSKSKEVRRAVCSVLGLIFQTWPLPQLSKHASLMGEVLRKGLTDADAEARLSAREAFPSFQRAFPPLALSILDTLDPLQKRQLSASLQAPPTRPKPALPQRPITVPKTNGAPPNSTASLSRQGKPRLSHIHPTLTHA
jgi:CLIP-associating protein 1/2